MGTTGAKTSSVEAVLDVLRQHPDATAAQIAEHAGIGRSTVTRTLANLETQGRVTRQRGTAEAGGRPAPDRWTRGPDTPADQLEARRPLAQEPAAEPADATVTASRHEDADSTNALRPSRQAPPARRPRRPRPTAPRPPARTAVSGCVPGGCAPSSTPGWPSGPARSSPRPGSARSWDAAPARSATH